MSSDRRRKRIGFGQDAIKLSDVARISGVSSATVSRALNNPKIVSEHSLSRIQQAVSELGYLPNSAGRALASCRTHTIGALIPTLSNPIFAAGVGGFETTLNELGYSVIVSSTDYHLDREERQARTLIERGASALMFMGGTHETDLRQLLTARRIPFVNTWVYDPRSEDPCIGFDNEHAAMQLVDHLVGLGHERFAMIAGITDENDRAAARVKGVRKALKRRKLPLPVENVIECEYSVSSGRGGLRTLMDRIDPRPTAIICGNDLQAFGAIFEANAMGLKVSADLSITGFDDIEMASHVPPGLTTMHVPSREMGVSAATFLTRRLMGESASNHVRIDTKLVIRGSTGPVA
jgi:LacI family transcriptional regulator